jgi:hypothetical protein
MRLLFLYERYPLLMDAQMRHHHAEIGNFTTKRQSHETGHTTVRFDNKGNSLWALTFSSHLRSKETSSLITPRASQLNLQYSNAAVGVTPHISS